MPQLAKTKYCTGCTACVAICPGDCITMSADETGFYHPSIDESKCAHCGLCEKICPVLNHTERSHTPFALVVRSKDDVSRIASTSGGIFAEIARSVLEKGGAVFGAAYDDDFRVVHICAKNEIDMDRIRGAKYAQSDLSGIFREVKQRLETGQYVLFSGTPCQVLGLKAYLQCDYENLLLVDLVCHSVPSPYAWKKYLQYISGKKMISAVNLRCKDTGWSRYGYSNRFDFSDGSCQIEKSSDSLYMKLFGGGYITHPACSLCPAKGYARVSDLTIGDFWGIWDIAPEMDDDKGTSVVLVQSKRGAELFEEIKQKLIVKPVSLEEASRENPAMLESSRPNEKREEAFRLILAGEIEQCAKWFVPPKIPITRRLYSMAKRLFRKAFCVRNNK